MQLPYRIRRLEDAAETENALRLAWRTFDAAVAPLYTPEGVESFHAYVDMLRIFPVLTYWGAFGADGGTLLGMTGLRAEDRHITLLFVDPAHQRCGIGRALTDAAVSACEPGAVTVHAAPPAVDFYRAVGFCKTGGETEKDGIRYVPMCLRR